MKAFPKLALVCALFFALAPNAWATSGIGSIERVPHLAPAVARSLESTRSVIVGFDSGTEIAAMSSCATWV